MQERWENDSNFTTIARIVGKGPLMKVDGGSIDWTETHMMALRWNVIEFRSEIRNPEEKRPCALCFARYIKA